MQKPAPIVDPGTQPYWDALKEKKLLLRSCRACGKAHYYPRELCPHCHSDDLEWLEAKGEGEIYSYTVVHRPAGPAFSEEVPYTVAIVTLDEGPRMMTRITSEPSSVQIGKRVKIEFQSGENEWVLPFFTIVP